MSSMTSLPRLLLAAVLFVALATTAGAADECIAVNVSGGAAGAGVFTDDFETGDTSRWGIPVVASFSIAATVDLVAQVTLAPTVVGEHVLEIRWLLPGGHLYQSESLPISLARLPEGSRRQVAGYPFPVAVRSLGHGVRTLESGLAVVEQALPVGGTPVATTSLTGLWAVEVVLDGADTPCGPSGSFRLDL